ncbi:glycoside hydrolase family 108 protein [Labrys portucalensis]|uniref:Glycoside hydrolase family 108 protein n=1 Tax=Labrys neptuniae TaxID=376174 RepID=A0ABV6Z9D7_9HYPH
MSDTLAQSIKLVFGSEGGYVNHPKDPGGATKYGITAATLGAWRKLGRKAMPPEVAALTLAEATRILDKQYAQPIRYAELPSPIDYVVFDEAVNSGPVQAIRDLQACVGAKVDGNIGINTLRAVQGVNDRAALVRKLCTRRLGFMRRLRTWVTFGRGWTNRVNHVQATALAMIK